MGAHRQDRLLVDHVVLLVVLEHLPLAQTLHRERRLRRSVHHQLDAAEGPHPQRAHHAQLRQLYRLISHVLRLPRPVRRLPPQHVGAVSEHRGELGAVERQADRVTRRGHRRLASRRVTRSALLA